MGMKQIRSLMKWQNLGIIKSYNQIGPPFLGSKASKTPILREKMKMDILAPDEGNKWHNLENQNNDECKLKLRNANWNANHRGTPHGGRGGARKLGTRDSRISFWKEYLI